MDEPNSTFEGFVWRTTTGFFVVGALLAGLDLFQDYGEGAPTRHLVTEGLFLVTACLGAALGVQRLLATRRQAEEARVLAQKLLHQLSRKTEEAERWRNETLELLQGLSAAIDRQLEAWELSPAEKETALLLLKGLGLKEISQIRGVSEATARQQARAIYKKGRLDGRHELAAFFLEDLLVPQDHKNQE